MCAPIMRIGMSTCMHVHVCHTLPDNTTSRIGVHVHVRTANLARVGAAGFSYSALPAMPVAHCSRTKPRSKLLTVSSILEGGTPHPVFACGWLFFFRLRRAAREVTLWLFSRLYPHLTPTSLKR